VLGRGAGFLAGEKRRADLCSCCAECESRLDAGAIRNAARRDHGTGVLIITHSISDPANFDRVLELDGSHAVTEVDPAQPD